MFELLNRFGLQDGACCIQFGTDEGASVLQSYDVISSFQLDEAQTLNVVMRQLGGVKRARKHHDADTKTRKDIKQTTWFS